MTRRELMARIGGDELTGWMAFDRIETSESWKQTAQICAVIANSFRGSKGRPMTAEDFLPRRGRKSPADVDARLRAWVEGMASRGKKGGPK